MSEADDRTINDVLRGPQGSTRQEQDHEPALVRQVHQNARRILAAPNARDDASNRAALMMVYSAVLRREPAATWCA